MLICRYLLNNESEYKKKKKKSKKMEMLFHYAVSFEFMFSERNDLTG